MNLGSEIRRRRRWLDLTQVQLANKVGCHPTRVSVWENGKGNIGARNLIALEKALEMEQGELIKMHFSDSEEKGGEGSEEKASGFNGEETEQLMNSGG